MWGSYAAMSKFALNQLDVFQLQFYTYGIALCAMFIIFIIKKQFKEIKKLLPGQIKIMIICGLSFCAYHSFYNFALSMADEYHLTTVIMINYLFPIFIAIFSVPINGESLNLRQIISILISFIGAGVVITGGAGFVVDLKSLPMYLLALTAAVSWGLFSGFGKKIPFPCKLIFLHMF